MAERVLAVALADSRRFPAQVKLLRRGAGDVVQGRLRRCRMAAAVEADDVRGAPAGSIWASKS